MRNISEPVDYPISGCCSGISGRMVGWGCCGNDYPHFYYIRYAQTLLKGLEMRPDASFDKQNLNTMPAIKNLEGLTTDEINRELAHGAKFVMYQYTISIVLLTFKRSSDIYFIRASENGTLKGLPFTIMSFVLGWWGIPWGPIYTIGSLYNNLSGGKNVTQDVLNLMNGAATKEAA